jgi:hypothetical protein
MKAQMKRSKGPVAQQAHIDDGIVVFASVLGQLPSFSCDLLPAGRYTHVSDLSSALKRAGADMHALLNHRGDLVVDRAQASELLLSLILVRDTKTKPLSEDFGIQDLLKLNHKEVVSAVADVKRIYQEQREHETDFVGVMKAIDSTRNPELTRRVLPLVKPRATRVSSSAGIIDLSIDHEPPKALQFDEPINVSAKVVGGLDESSGSFVIQVTHVPPVAHCVIRANVRYRVNMIYSEHRSRILLAQLLQTTAQMTIKVDAVPLSRQGGQDLRAHLEQITFDMADPDSELLRLAKQLKLDLASSSGHS